MNRIRTTHVGSLPRPDNLFELNRRRLASRQPADQDYWEGLRAAVLDVVKKQEACGIDIVNDGEFGKAMQSSNERATWMSYIFERVGGWEPGEPVHRVPFVREAELFPGFYGEYSKVWNQPAAPTSPNQMPTFTDGVSFTGQSFVEADVNNLRSAIDAGGGDTEAFITSVTPSSLAGSPHPYYETNEAFLAAATKAMMHEYQTIVNAGFILQLDDPGLAIGGARNAMPRIEALNEALADIPEERIRYHVCWGAFNGPHITDTPLADIVDALLHVRAGGYLIEAANARHEHEWRIWENTKLPEGRVIIPGVVSHVTNVVEHPELVAERIVRFANLVGRENVIAGTDCGMGGRVHPEIAWAKLTALTEGAALASKKLWP